MARVIPETAFNDPEIRPGEKRLLRALYQNLDDSCIVWYQPKIDADRRPDLIIYIPEIGLVLVEVKDWPLSIVKSATPDYWEIIINGKIERHNNPLKRVKSYFYNLLDNLKKDNSFLTIDGPHKGNVKLPIATCVSFPNITRAEYLSSDFSKTIDVKYILFKDEIADIGNNLVGKTLIDRIKKIFDPWWKNDELNSEEMDKLRGILYPEITAKQKDKGGNVKEIILDETQEQVAKKLGEGHRIIRGVAGSGKSLVLCAKIRMLLKEKPNWQILLTCYNISLASQLRYYLYSFNDEGDVANEDYRKVIQSKVKIIHFHGLAKEIIPQGGWPLVDKEQLLTTARFANLEDHEIEAELDEMYSSLLGAKLQQLAATTKLPLYDAIVVDESQDFHPSWLKALMIMLKRTTNFLLLAEDPNQKIYPRTFTYKDTGINVVGGGRIFNLPISYRSTREIVITASKLVRTSDWDDFYKKFLEENDELPKTETQKNGRLPEIIIKNDYMETCQFIASDILYKVSNQGFSFNDFGVLYTIKKTEVIDYITPLCAVLAENKIPFFWLSEDKDSKTRYDQFRREVTISTVFSAKGLEFETVYFVGVEIYPWIKRNRRENASLLYVGMTRAKSELYMCSLMETEITRQLKTIIDEFSSASI
ncbi:nuclease-related domain-containing DEAD/DEAH box helicase [Ignavibacterium sp.]|uniref:3'-5' exonuclease n=1 Tax=Ignavibacterium sp. TaxID=2651167 RepID=UPI0021F9E0E5|nr:nuclease-related domain-containing DEAD/DEAH box helicase [Ignavibacterium sp.]BDQ01543.1 MAG: DNA helicase [Ignavibacterium sp.]